MTTKYNYYSLLVFLCLFFAQFYPQISSAYQTISESGELISADNYRFGFETQFGSGANLTGFVDAPLNEVSQLRVLAGTGDVDFYAGVSYKWIPFPDLEKQPAVGLRVGSAIGRETTDNFVAFSGSPLVSKKIETPQGLAIPYLALPITYTSHKSKTTNALQLAIGSEFNTPELKKWGFGGELGINIKDSQSYIAFFATIIMDENIRGK